MNSSYMRAAISCTVFIGIVAVVGDSARAVPRFSLISGTRCSACHLNPQGGGIRNELGWQSMNEVGAWRWPWSPKRTPVDDGGEEELFNAPSDAPADGQSPFDEAPDDTTSIAPTDDLPVEEIPSDDGASDELPDDLSANDTDASETDAARDFETADPLPAHEPTAVAVDVYTTPTPAAGSTDPINPSAADTAISASAGDDATGASARDNAMGASARDETSSASPADEAGSASEGDDAPIEVHTNSFLDGLITVGVDARVQMTKTGRPPNDVRRYIPMQTQVNLAVTPVDWFAVYGGFNASTLEFFYPGQSGVEATAQLSPGVRLPVLRVGYMQPSIGIRHDDHTTFARRNVAGSSARTLIPPGYAELGVEAHYEGMSWLTVNAGVFGSKNLADIVSSIDTSTSIADFSTPSLLGRIVLWPQDLDLGFNGELGASYYGNVDFQMINIFAGIGLSDRGSVYVESLMADYSDDRHVRNVSILGSYQLFTWFSLHWRYEFAQSEDAANSELVHAHQAVFGAEFFPFPHVEIRPEYRFFQTEPYARSNGYVQGQYTLQLHVFY